jgi:flavin-binding protein dodecin
MAESVYNVIELVGTSTESWEKAAAAAIERASKSLRDLRVAEVVEQDLQVRGQGLTGEPAFLSLLYDPDADAIGGDIGRARTRTASRPSVASVISSTICDIACRTRRISPARACIVAAGSASPPKCAIRSERACVALLIAARGVRASDQIIYASGVEAARPQLARHRHVEQRAFSLCRSRAPRTTPCIGHRRSQSGTDRPRLRAASWR